jgi:hypothetical protein
MAAIGHLDDEPGARHHRSDPARRAGAQAALHRTEPRYDPGGGINLARGACVGRRSSRDLIRPRGRERDDNKLGVRL